MKKLSRDFYDRPTLTVARELLGKELVRVLPSGEVRRGRINEVEAYIGGKDLACHASKGMTKRNQIMFGPPGFAYVYLIYGMYHCLNFVTEEESKAAAVLIRGIDNFEPKRINGPGKLTRFLEITRDQSGHDLTGDELYVLDAPAIKSHRIRRSPRIGVDYAGEWALKPWRFYIPESI